MIQYITEPSRKTNPELLNKIKLVRGRILEQNDVDAIAFYMTRELEWAGSLNKRLLEQAGDDLDSYVLDHIFQPRAGDVFQLPAFKLPYKALFLMMLPFWKDGIGSEERSLLQGYRSLVMQMRKAGIKRLAIPVMGNEQRKFPRKRAIRLSLNGIVDSLSEEIEEIRIVSINPEMHALYRDRLKRMFNKNRGC